MRDVQVAGELTTAEAYNARVAAALAKLAALGEMSEFKPELAKLRGLVGLNENLKVRCAVQRSATAARSVHK